MSASPVLSREQVRELDRRAIEEHGIPSVVLMENAGRACADAALELVGDDARGVLVLCGPGNNGGDGLVIARTLVNRGRDAAVVFVGSLERLEGATGDVATNLRLWRDVGGRVEVVEDAADARSLAPRLADSSLAVDALFGTGLVRALAPPFADAIEALNATRTRVLAVDLPSGLDADTGEVLGVAVRADSTVTFVASKPGFVRGAGPAHCGTVRVAEIGIPRGWIEAAVSRSS